MKLRALTATICAIALVAVYSAGCKKTIINNYHCGCVKDSCKDEVSDWYGLYAIPGQSTSVGDSTFIAEGIARLDDSPYFGMWFSGLRLDIPECRDYSADSVKFEARLKNPVAEGAIEELDVSLVIYGATDSAYVNYIGRAHRQDFTRFGIYNGTPLQTNLPELIQLFQDWSTVSIEVKNGQLYTYKDGVLIKQMSLNGKKLGKLKKINVGFKGVGSVDWVKVYDNAGNVKVKEEFNTNQQSSVEFF